jgi:exodeoxyribonuclease III
MKVATWNVNGIRARASQVHEWPERERPDVVCLQELKAEPAQVPEAVQRQDYHAFWHCCKGYSGVSLQLRKETFPDDPVYSHPHFDLESRIVTVALGDLTRLIQWGPRAASRRSRAGALRRREHRAHRDGRASKGAEAHGRRAATGGTRHVRDVAGHGADRCGASDGSRQRRLVHLWAPWRNLRARNIGWRLDYLLASPGVFTRVQRCVVQADVGTSEHAPVVMTTS